MVKLTTKNAEKQMEKLVLKRNKLYEKKEKLDKDYKEVLDKLRGDKKLTKRSEEALKKKKEKYEEKQKELLKNIEKVNNDIEPIQEFIQGNSKKASPKPQQQKKKPVKNQKSKFKEIQKKLEQEQQKQKNQYAAEINLIEMDKQNEIDRLERLKNKLEMKKTLNNQEKKQLEDIYKELREIKGDAFDEISMALERQFDEQKEQKEQKQQELEKYLKENPQDAPMVNKMRREQLKMDKKTKKAYGKYIVGDQNLNDFERRPIKRLDESKELKEYKDEGKPKFKAISKVAASRNQFFENMKEARFYGENDDQEEEEEEEKQKNITGMNWADIMSMEEEEEVNNKVSVLEKKNKMREPEEAVAAAVEEEDPLNDKYIDLINDVSRLKEKLSSSSKNDVYSKMYKGFDLEPQIKYIRPGSTDKDKSPSQKCNIHMNIVGNYICHYDRKKEGKKPRWFNRKTENGKKVYMKRINSILKQWEKTPDYKSVEDKLGFKLLDGEKKTLQKKK